MEHLKYYKITRLGWKFGRIGSVSAREQTDPYYFETSPKIRDFTDFTGPLLVPEKSCATHPDMPYFVHLIGLIFQWCFQGCLLPLFRDIFIWWTVDYLVLHPWVLRNSYIIYGLGTEYCCSDLQMCPITKIPFSIHYRSRSNTIYLQYQIILNGTWQAH